MTVSMRIKLIPSLVTAVLAYWLLKLGLSDRDTSQASIELDEDDSGEDKAITRSGTTAPFGTWELTPKDAEVMGAPPPESPAPQVGGVTVGGTPFVTTGCGLVTLTAVKNTLGVDPKEEVRFCFAVPPQGPPPAIAPYGGFVYWRGGNWLETIFDANTAPTWPAAVQLDGSIGGRLPWVSKTLDVEALTDYTDFAFVPPGVVTEKVGEMYTEAERGQLLPAFANDAGNIEGFAYKKPNGAVEFMAFKFTVAP